ncbi:hypothetical protein ACOBV9_22045 (plasmid) [Pseudoalteromonas espejiana]
MYDTPFWRKQTPSGSARSSVGPMAEIHDASNPEGQAALFGFNIGIPADDRKRISNEDLITHCRAQLIRFSAQAATPKPTSLKIGHKTSHCNTFRYTRSKYACAQVPNITAQNGPSIKI